MSLTAPQAATCARATIGAVMQTEQGPPSRLRQPAEIKKGKTDVDCELVDGG